MAAPDFNNETILKLGQRVAYRCSNPDCGVRTIGPNQIPTKATLICEAAHIRGARPGTARYDPQMTDAERADISNGIWLCGDCHKRIDSDPDKFPIDLLKKWKVDAEAQADAHIGKREPIISLPLIPHQIPPPPADFTGRDTELASLLQAHKDGACISGLKGIGGIGKTALAFALAEHLAPQYPDGQLMLDMLGTSQTPLTPAAAMRQVIQVFHPETRLPENETELKPLYLSVLHGKKLILLLDNAHSRPQVEPLIPPKTCFLLITSRWHFTLPGLKSFDLEALSEQDAVNLLLTIEPRLKDSASFLASLCEYLPLALRLSASAFADQPSCPLKEFLARFTNTQSRLQLTGMDTSLQVSYDLLPPNLQAKLRFLSVFPAPFDRRAAAAVWDLDEQTAQPSLDSLVTASLLDYDELTGFRLHDLVRAFASAKLSSEESYTTSLHHASHYLNIARQASALYKQGGDHILAGLRLFDLHWPHIRQGQAWASAQPETDQRAIRLCNEYPAAITSIRSLRLHPEQQIAWLQTALTVARLTGNKEYQGYHMGSLGNAYRALGQVDKAIEHYQQALLISREIGNRRGEGGLLGNLGNAYRNLDQVDQAIDNYQQALVIARAIGNRLDEGMWLRNLGNAYRAIGQVDKAIKHNQQALLITREIGDRRGEADALGNLGLAYRALGQLDQAIDHYQQALLIYSEIGDRRGEGQDLGSLGNAYSALGQVDQAIEHYQQALLIAREVGDRRGEGLRLGNLASTYENQGDLPRAVPLAAAAHQILAEIKSPHKDWAFSVLNRLHQKLGDAAFNAALSQPPNP